MRLGLEERGAFIIVVIIVRIIAGATERRLASPFDSSRVSNISTGVGVSGNIGELQGELRRLGSN